MNEYDKFELQRDFKLLLGSLFLVAPSIFAYLLTVCSLLGFSVKEALLYFLVLFVITVAPVGCITLMYLTISDIVNIIHKYKFIIAIPKGETNDE